MTSLKYNIVASYASQIYVIAIGILLLPEYVKLMGAEAYGLVGFYAIMQAWFMLLELGLTPTMLRETARFRGGSTGAITLRRSCGPETIFIVVALLGAAAVVAFSRFISPLLSGPRFIMVL
jgi:O-antigen/teichoic acid export membrane protein